MNKLLKVDVKFRKLNHVTAVLKIYVKFQSFRHNLNVTASSIKLWSNFMKNRQPRDFKSYKIAVTFQIKTIHCQKLQLNLLSYFANFAVTFRICVYFPIFSRFSNLQSHLRILQMLYEISIQTWYFQNSGRATVPASFLCQITHCNINNASIMSTDKFCMQTVNYEV